MSGRTTGAWWPQSDRMISNELPTLVGELAGYTGAIDNIALNWTDRSHRSTMELHPQLGTAKHWAVAFYGNRCTVSLVLIPSATRTELAAMILRVAASMPVDAADGFETVRFPYYVAAQRILNEAKAS